jgi:hypothetical protein
MNSRAQEPMSLRDTSGSASVDIRRVSLGLQSGAVLGRHQSIAVSMPQLPSMRPFPLGQTDSSSERALRNTNDGLAAAVQLSAIKEIEVAFASITFVPGAIASTKTIVSCLSVDGVRAVISYKSVIPVST